MKVVMGSAVHSVLYKLHGKLEGLRQARRVYEPLLATEFNPIELLSPCENDLSRILANLLSPIGSHGQGRLFLQLFIDEFNLKDSLADSWIDAENVQVETEAQIAGQRRIDVKLSFIGGGSSTLNGAIGIENKPWAMDQKNQVASYIEDLQEKFELRHILIYLSGNGGAPTEFSTGGKNFPSLKVVSYADLNCWLRLCAQKAQAIRVKFFLEELVKYIDKKFSGVQDMSEHKMIIDDICKSPEYLDAALSVSSAMPGIKNFLLRKMLDEFRGAIQTKYTEWVVKIDLESAQNSKYCGVSVLFSKDDSYCFRLEFEQNEFNELIFGISKSTNKSENRPDLCALIGDVLGSSLQSPYWPWYKNYGPSRFGNDSESWKQIQSGSMGKKLFEDVSNLYERLKDENLLEQLR